MAVSSDIGSKNDVHPRNKKDVGERLARWAMKQVYKESIIPSGPLPSLSNHFSLSLTTEETEDKQRSQRSFAPPLFLFPTFFLLANHKELKEDTKATMDLCVR